MADKIINFFKKKKSDVQFKRAGPGHRLSEATLSSQSSTSVKNEPVVRRTGLSEESKTAAEAALARMQKKSTNPGFNTSYAAIQAQVKKELENERATTSKPQELKPDSEAQKDNTEELLLPKNMATNGVFFKCPMINDEVLTKQEWKAKIKEFLYEQLEEERGLTACLIIQSCNDNREKVNTCVETLCKYLENIVTYPEEEKYQKIRMSNRAFADRVQPIEGSMDLLMAAGFTQQTLPNPDGQDEQYLVFNKDNVPSVESLISLIEALRSAEPVPLELDRGLQVLLPSQAVAKVQLPPSFYALKPEDIKREQQLRTEAIEKMQMLRTKAMREKDELREMRKYKFAIIRVRFPDGILLQGTFSVYEHYSEIHDFVQQNLEYDLPFILNTPTGHKLTLEEDATKTLIDLRLVPATVLTFAWHPSVIDQINSSPNKDVFLKPEVMVLVNEI